MRSAHWVRQDLVNTCREDVSGRERSGEICNVQGFFASSVSDDQYALFNIIKLENIVDCDMNADL